MRVFIVLALFVASVFAVPSDHLAHHASRHHDNAHSRHHHGGNKHHNARHHHHVRDPESPPEIQQPGPSIPNQVVPQPENTTINQTQSPINLQPENADKNVTTNAPFLNGIGTGIGSFVNNVGQAAQNATCQTSQFLQDASNTAIEAIKNVFGSIQNIV